MDILASKIELTKLILDIEDADLIERIKVLLENESGDFWKTLSAGQKEELKLGLKLLNEGKRTSFEDFLEKVQ